MTNMHTPHQLAGWLTYNPRFPLAAHRELELRDLLVDHTHIEEPENPTIPLEWFFNNADGPPYYTREGVLLYRDGGDSELPAVLFYRFPIQSDHLQAPAVHIPPADQQARLADAGGDLWQTFEGNLTRTTAALTVLKDYVDSIINDPDQWTTFEFTDEYEGVFQS